MHRLDNIFFMANTLSRSKDDFLDILKILLRNKSIDEHEQKLLIKKYELVQDYNKKISICKY